MEQTLIDALDSLAQGGFKLLIEGFLEFVGEIVFSALTGIGL